MKLGIKKEVEVEAKTLRINATCRDCCSATLVDSDGTTIHESDGYVPPFMPEEHFGDYIILDIDIETGLIKNWVPPTVEALKEWINE